MEEAEIKICEVSGEKVDNKVRLDVVKKEEQMIAEENEELLQEEEEKKKKVFNLSLQVEQSLKGLYHQELAYLLNTLLLQRRRYQMNFSSHN